MIASSILLGAVFIAIGYLVSALVRERATAAGIAIGVWLLLVVIYDMALLGLLVVDQGRLISAQVLSGLLLLNPTDVYRLFNLAGTANVSMFSGMTGLADTITLSPHPSCWPRSSPGRCCRWRWPAFVFARREL